MFSRAPRILVASALLALVACGGGDDGSSSAPVLGKRVVFTANTTGPQVPNEIWVTDTAGTPQSPSMLARITLVGTTRVERPFVSPGGAYLGARVAHYSISTPTDGCPAAMHIFSAATNVVTADYPLGGSACAHELEFSPNGANFALRFAFAGATGANLAAQPTSFFPATMVTVDTNAAVQTGGTVQLSRWSLDGNTIAWTEAGGLYSSPGSGGGSAHLRSTDVPASFVVGQLAAVPYAVYVAPGETRLRITNLDPLAAQSQAYLTNVLGAGDTIGALKLSPDGSLLLYEARIAGAWQLWMVALAAPLTEQRVDTVAPIVTTSQEDSFNGHRTRYAFSPDNTRFAWSGNTGGGVQQVLAAAVATPANATILTPATERVYRDFFWSDADTLVYGEWGFGTGFSTGIHARTVSLNAPLSTAALWSASVGDSDRTYDSMSLCGDGTVVYMTSNIIASTAGDSWRFSGLYAVDPNAPASLRQITPVYGNFNTSPYGVSAFDCE
jgi:hypothetical protein